MEPTCDNLEIVPLVGDVVKSVKIEWSTNTVEVFRGEQAYQYGTALGCQYPRRGASELQGKVHGHGVLTHRAPDAVSTEIPSSHLQSLPSLQSLL